MKTTIDIADGLFEEAKTLASRQGTTLKAVVETSLREFLAKREKSRAAFRLKDGSFRGQGLQPGIREGDWRAIESLIYEGRGA